MVELRGFLDGGRGWVGAQCLTYSEVILRSKEESYRVLEGLTDLTTVLRANFLHNGKGEPGHFSSTELVLHGSETLRL